MSTKHAQIQRTNFFFGGAERRAELLAEPACACNPCACGVCDQCKCKCDCPACVPGDTVSQVGRALQNGTLTAASLAIGVAAGIASDQAKSIANSVDSTFNSGISAVNSVG
jgi:hypothetical protein